MKKVKIVKLSLLNFKGIKKFEIEFNDSTRIYGDNATGKTTLVDAFTWLLFGKDSNDKKDFNIKTLDSENNVIEKLDHEVTGTFEVNNQSIVLRRVLREKWVTRRGSETPEMQGHETLFFWNDVPLQAGEFQAKVDAVISEQNFKMITSPLYFNSLKWQERRNILITIAGNISDADIAGSRKDFLDLLSIMGDKSLEEYKKELAAKRKKLKDELVLIPARIAELDHNTPEVKDWNVIQAEIDILNNQIESIDSQIADSSKGHESFYQEKQNRLRKVNGLKTKISDIEFRGRQVFSNMINERSSAIESAKIKIDKLNTRKRDSVKELETLRTSIEIFKGEQAKLREQWMKVNEEEMPEISANETVCYACGQALPEDQLHSKKSHALVKFNADKDKRLTQIRAEGLAINPRIEKLENQITELQAEDFDVLIAAQNEIIRTWEAKKVESVQVILADNSEYHQAVKDLQEMEAIPEAEIAPVVDNSELKQKKTTLTAKVFELTKEMNAKEQIKQSQTRRTELENQEKEFASQLASHEKAEFTVSEFIKAKVDILEARINSMFSGVKFRLFDTQINGGLIECCDTLINGVPWSDANNAARINAGISIINVLSNHYGQTAPIWIDNSESITNIHETDSQCIELYVSEPDKTLRIA
jgi:exonuclease SbcC